MAMSRDDLGVCHIETRHWQAMFRGICVKHRQTYGIANTVPAAEGVPAGKRGTPTGGASGIDCSALVPSPICTSSTSEEGKSIAGGDDMTTAAMREEVGRDATRQFWV